MTGPEIRQRLARIEHVHPAEKGCTVGELRQLLSDYADTVDERDKYRTIAELKEGGADANRTQNNQLVTKVSALERSLERSQQGQAIAGLCLAAAVTHMNDLVERVAR